MFLEMLPKEEKMLSGSRARAQEKARSIGFPTKKTEAFKYVPLKEVERGNFSLLESCYTISCSSDKVEILSMDQAMKKYGVLITNRLEKTLDKEESFFSLVNRGWGRDAFCIFINESVSEVITIEEKFIGDNKMICPQLQFFIAGRVSATLHHKIEVLGTQNMINRTVDVSVEKNADVTFYETAEVSCENDVFFHTSSAIKKSAKYTHRSGTLGCRIFRNEIKTYLLERDAACVLEGFWNGSKDDNIHHHVHCSHLAEETKSRQHYQGVCDGAARASFEGQIYVDQIAQKTDSYQLSKHLLIGDKARAFTKPNLEVFADDVIASHGATISTLNEEELFYLTSRGISKEQAAILLKHGFLSFFLDRTEDTQVRKSFNRLIEQ
jgi:Fe-S cluster assembly protein SufD